MNAINPQSLTSRQGETVSTRGQGTSIHDDARLPLVYSCSGASSAAQMANHIAVKLDRLGVAEMSCIAGVGGDVKPLVRTAKSGRPIIALDGCPLHCAAQILRRHGIQPDRHYDLSKLGVKKRMHEDFDPGEAARLIEKIAAESKDGGCTPTDPAPDIPDALVLSSRSDLSGRAKEEALKPAGAVCYRRELPTW